MALTFHNFGEAELELLKTWFADSLAHRRYPELARRISFPTTQWFDHVRNTLGVYAWMIFDGDTPIGHVQVDIDAANNAYPALVVKPELRNQGYGTQILHALVNRPELSGVRCFTGYVEADNLACQRCCLAAGFRQVNERCVWLQDQPELIRSTTHFHWWSTVG